MVTGPEQLTRVEYEEKIRKKNYRELLIDVAMQQYDMSVNCAKNCEQPSQRSSMITGGGAGAIIVGIIEFIKWYFIGK
jgi:hypothetical protein